MLLLYVLINECIIRDCQKNLTGSKSSVAYTTLNQFFCHIRCLECVNFGFYFCKSLPSFSRLWCERTNVRNVKLEKLEKHDGTELQCSPSIWTKCKNIQYLDIQLHSGWQKYMYSTYSASACLIHYTRSSSGLMARFSVCIIDCGFTGSKSQGTLLPSGGSRCRCRAWTMCCS